MKQKLMFILSHMLLGLGLCAQTTVYEVTSVGTLTDLDMISGIATDNYGNTYVAAISDHKILKINSSGQVTTLAGSGVAGDVDGIGVNASFRYPKGIAVDAYGNVFVADAGNRKIRKINLFGNVTTYAGSGEMGSVDDVCNKATFYHPSDIALDGNGNVYVVDVGYIYELQGSRIRKITTSGMVETIAGSGALKHTDGIGRQADLETVKSITIDASGNLFVSEYSFPSLRVCKINPTSGLVTTIATYRIRSNSTKFETLNTLNMDFYVLNGIELDASGNIYVSSPFDEFKVFKITQSGVVSTICGSFSERHTDGIGVQASFKQPTGIALDASGNILVSDYSKIRKITPKAPAPPVVSYVDLPNGSSLCMGSTLNKTPEVTGSEYQMKFHADSINAGAAKNMCRGVNGDIYVLYQGDSIVRYSISGSRIMRYDQMGILSNITRIAVDANHKVYAHADGINTNAIHRINESGTVEFGGFLTPANYYSGLSDMKVGKDGYLYVSDTIVGGIDKVDTTTSIISNYAGPFEKADGVNSMSFGKNELYIFKKAEQKIYARTLGATGNFTQVFQGLDTLGINFDQFWYDTSMTGSIIVSSYSNGKIYRFDNYGSGFDFNLDPSRSFEYTSLKGVKARAFVWSYSNSSSPQVLWVGSSTNKLISMNAYGFTVSPPLPKGLSFDPLKGRIIGTPTATAPAATYTITVNNYSGGTTSHTINFSVDPPGQVSNAIGTATSQNEQSDGFDINYFNNNNCEEMMNIKDAKGGTVVGKVEVKQKVLPTLATFATGGTFTRRVTEIKTSNPDADARIKIYYTYYDVEHFNQTNAVTDTDLTNDTIAGTMQVGVLQLHTNEKGITEQIKHNPVTANWQKTNAGSKKVWVVDFPVTKFSTFYMGESSSLTSFDCTSIGPTTSITSCGYYFWRGKAYTASGIYKDTTANQYGCDSVLTLDLTVTNNITITRDMVMAEYLSCNETGATYQWINCDNGGTLLSGATSQDYTAAVNGNYSVIVTKNSCTDTSLCVSVTNLSTITGIQEADKAEVVTVFPNPGKGVFVLNAAPGSQIRVLSVYGTSIIETTTTRQESILDLAQYGDGIYYIQIRTEDTNSMLKLVKQ